ncbi:ATP-binding protein [Microbacterium proteolyticum]|uniref:ATP-binding protein n=1 Tax=Microbacterium proteolyticum TaxID=1572644 RepID=UPI001FAC4786|nr:ATP-binding protein [Microbacterium proteolyticum]MCI9858680.1 hypothetical protein [Microbacterium proteolyticum]
MDAAYPLTGAFLMFLLSGGKRPSVSVTSVSKLRICSWGQRTTLFEAIVRMSVEISVADGLIAILRDNAEPVPLDPAAATMADALAETGRGLAIAAAVCDELSVEHRNGNVWRLVRYL